jgi:hypothetical protein
MDMDITNLETDKEVDICSDRDTDMNMDTGLGNGMDIDNISEHGHGQ